MEGQKVANWIPCIIDGDLFSYTCSNCEEEEGSDALEKYRRCPNCNYRMENAL